MGLAVEGSLLVHDHSKPEHKQNGHDKRHGQLEPLLSSNSRKYLARVCHETCHFTVVSVPTSTSTTDYKNFSIMAPTESGVADPMVVGTNQLHNVSPPPVGANSTPLS